MWCAMRAISISRVSSSSEKKSGEKFGECSSNNSVANGLKLCGRKNIFTPCQSINKKPAPEMKISLHRAKHTEARARARTAKISQTTASPAVDRLKSICKPVTVRR
jgi:hypothetical protein